MKLFGKAGKAGKEQRPEQVDAGNGGRSMGGNVIPGVTVRYGRDPIAWSYAQRLFAATTLTSPMVAGRFRPQDEGAPTNRGTDGGSPDLGALQLFRGLVGRPMGTTLGKSQQGYPSTGDGNAAILAGLANMGRPDVQRIGGL